MGWKWFFTPADVRGKSAIYSGLLTGVLTLLSAPLWSQYEAVGAAIAAGLSGLISGIAVKLWMERKANE